MSTSPVLGPSPEKIGKSFIKQYYQTLLTNPSQLIRFYQADSTISRGSAAEIAETAGCAAALSGEDPGEAVRSAFFSFAGCGSGEGGELSIDFSSGAIDAQESVGGGILLVVTGHMYLPQRTGFVHTFFLNNAAPEGRKKVFYVKNDVLRFLGEEKADVVESVDVGVDAGLAEMNGATQAEEIAVEEEPAVAVEDLIEQPVAEMPVVEQLVEDVIDYNEPAAEEEKMEIIDNLEVEGIAEDEPAAEEEKIEVVDESPPDSPANSKGSDGKRSKRNRRKKGGKASRSNSPSDKSDKEDTPEKPKTPGSWASLVATGQPKKSGRRSSPKSRREEKQSAPTNHDKAPQDRTPKESAPAPTPTPTSSSTRTPEATLFIRNVPDATKESEIRSLFEPVAVSNGNKILGITLNPNRGFCFVDFDSVTAVDAVVAEAEKSLVKEPRTGRKVSSSFMAHGRVLDVERKVKSENKGFRNSRGRAGMRRSPPRGR